VKKLFLVLVINLLLIGCKKDAPVLQFETLNIEQVSEVSCNPEEENCTFIGLEIPWAMGKDTRSMLMNSHIKNHVVQLIDYQDNKEISSLENLAQAFINDYETTAIEFPEYNIPWEAYVEGKVTYKSEKVISIQFDLALFTGGAHGYTSVTFLNFDPKSGKLLSNRDLFINEFKKVVEKRFRTKNSIPEKGPINSTGFFFENDTFQLPQNIGFHENKVILRYNAYEIASYSEGNIQLEFKIEDVKKYFNIL